MKNIQVEKQSLEFLKALAKNNQRDWFNNHKDQYLSAHNNMIQLVEALIPLMNQHDVLESASAKQSLYRIYNDVRFSKDKSPYKTRFAFGFQRATKQRRGGYYMHIQPGNSFLACGFFSPNPEDLKRIRADIDTQYESWYKILNSKKIKTAFGGLSGEQVLSAPRGYAKDHPAIELLRYKQFILKHDFTDAEVLAPNFHKTINEYFKSVQPFFDYMSEVLTTNLNGESIL